MLSVAVSVALLVHQVAMYLANRCQQSQSACTPAFALPVPPNVRAELQVVADHQSDDDTSNFVLSDLKGSSNCERNCERNLHHHH